MADPKLVLVDSGSFFAVIALTWPLWPKSRARGW